MEQDRTINKLRCCPYDCLDGLGRSNVAGKGKVYLVILISVWSDRVPLLEDIFGKLR